jgi:predicted aldo/keto reductase-like oxidoreductase
LGFSFTKKRGSMAASIADDEEVIMEKIRFGKSALMASRIAFGGIPIMRLSTAEAVKVVRGALDLGVNFIDTANAYLDSEEKIGAAIKGTRRDELILASKSGAGDKKTFNAHLDKCLAALGTDYVDFYQFHNIATKEKRDEIFAPGGAYEGMLEAVQAGKVRFPAFTSHNVALAVEIMKTKRFYSVQLPYNFLDDDAEREAIPLARRLDMGFIAMKPLGGGLLDDAGLCFRYILRLEGVLPDPGVESLRELEEIARIAERKEPFSDADRDAVERYRAELGPSWCHRCDYCQPCRQGIAISTALTAKSFPKRMPLTRVKAMLSGEFERARGCIECGDCMTRCPYHLAIPRLLKEVLAWWDAAISG